MQASRITFGKEYAVTYKGELKALRAIEMVTTRNSKGAENKVGGTIAGVFQEGDPAYGKHLKMIYYPVADILDEIEKYQKLMDEKAQREAEAKAKEDAATAKKQKVAMLLAKAVGVNVLPDTSYGSKYDRSLKDGPCIVAGYSEVEINSKAYDAVIAYLEKQGVTLDNVVAFKKEEA